MGKPTLGRALIAVLFVLVVSPLIRAQVFEDFGIPPQQMIAEAWTLYRNGQIEEALQMVRAAVKKDPDNPFGYIEIARMYRQLGRWDRVENAVRIGLEKHPNNPDLLYEWAHVQLKKGDGDGAFRTLTKVLLWNPRHESAHFWLGWLYLKRGETKSAAYHFRRVSRFDPHHRDAQILLSRIQKRRPVWGRFFKEIIILAVFLVLRVIGGLKKNPFLNRVSEIGVVLGILLILIKNVMMKS